MVSPADAASMSGRQIFFKILSDSVANILWYGAAAVVIAIIGKAIWWWAGIVLFGVFALILLASSAQTFFTTILGIAMIPMAIYEKIKGRSGEGAEQVWLGRAQIIQLIELAILVGYTYWLYKMFFKVI